MKLAKQITDKLGTLLVKFSHAGTGKNGGLALHYDTYKDEHDEFGTLTSLVEVFTDETSYILDHVNFITGYGDGKMIEQFFFNHDDFNDFEQHLLTLQKAQEDAYPEEVKQLNRELAQSVLTAPNMHLRICYNGKHIGSFSGVKLNKLHVKSFVTDKIYFNICYAGEPLECYDTFEEVTDAIDHFKVAIKRGATRFKFPTSDELNLPTDKQSANTTFEIGKAYFNRDFRDCAFTILDRKKNIVTFALKDFEDDEVYIQRARIRKDSRGEFFITKAEVLINTFEKVEIYAADLLAEVVAEQAQEPTKKQIIDSLQRAIDKAKLEYKIASVAGNQSKANFERELYLIAKKAIRELKF